MIKNIELCNCLAGATDLEVASLFTFLNSNEFEELYAVLID